MSYSGVVKYTVEQLIVERRNTNLLIVKKSDGGISRPPGPYWSENKGCVLF